MLMCAVICDAAGEMGVWRWCDGSAAAELTRTRLGEDVGEMEGVGQAARYQIWERRNGIESHQRGTLQGIKKGTRRHDESKEYGM